MRILRRIIRNLGRGGTAAGVFDLIAAIDHKVRGQESIEEVFRSLDAERDPLLGYLRRRRGSAVAAKALTLKILNLLAAKRELLARSTAPFSRPYGLMVDPSNGCNLACPGCVHSSTVKALKIFHWNKGLLSEALFRSLMQCYGSAAFQIMFCNYGEPLTNPNTPRLIEVAKGYYVQTALSTSLSIGRFDAEAYVRSGLDFMILSIDGATQKVYERYRQNGNIDVVYRNVEKLVRAKRTLRKRTPVIRWQFLAFEHNAHEIPLAFKTAKALGVDQFTVKAPFDVSWDDPGVQPADVPLMNVEFDPDTEESSARTMPLIRTRWPRKPSSANSKPRGPKNWWHSAGDRRLAPSCRFCHLSTLATGYIKRWSWTRTGEFCRVVLRLTPPANWSSPLSRIHARTIALIQSYTRRRGSFLRTRPPTSKSARRVAGFPARIARAANLSNW